MLEISNRTTAYGGLLPKCKVLAVLAGIAIGAAALSCGVLHQPQPFTLGLAMASQGAPADPQLVTLGRQLFFDLRLSVDGSLSCASCHMPENAFAERRRVSRGIGMNAQRRNTPTLLNVGFQTAWDWDGRASSLEAQLVGVFSRDGDMGWEFSDAVAVIARDSLYRRAFSIALRRHPDREGISAALAAFQRSLVVGDSRFDRFFFGGDSTALSGGEKRGWAIFNGSRGGCAACHKVLRPHAESGTVSALFTDNRFHNLGVGYDNGHMADPGRYIVTGTPLDWGSFKTPSLRNVALTAPYMHDGSLESLEDVVAFYNAGGIPNPAVDGILGRLSLSGSEQDDLIAFLRSLTSVALLDSVAWARQWGS